WVYEEIMLFLRAMRTALNYRLFSEMVGTDLERSEQIQKSLLPKFPPKIKGYLIAGRSQPADLVGGDFFEYFQFDQQDFGFAVGDASGHGLPAALLVRDVVIGLRMGLERNMRLVYTIKRLNRVIQQSTFSTNFVSLFIGEIEQDGHLFYANAGHPAPFVLDGNKFHDLDATGITLGFLPSIDLQRAYFRLNPGSILVAYSDGIVERHKNEEDQFGTDRLKALVKKNRDKSPSEIIDVIYKSVFDFGKKKQWEDDATVVVVKRLEIEE
ncbi:PP2C family protein-serine/threonine phosphatase, partial [bacterium]|nr:PP2C family protein-serine/threonine phosphatase [bacterium]